MIKGKPRRLELIFQRFDPPLYFVTFNTHQRHQILASPELHQAFCAYCEKAADVAVAVGRYVIMPDHVHLFVCVGAHCGIRIGDWVKGLKRCLDKTLLHQGYLPVRIAGQKTCSLWQPGFFDHLLRSDESYATKWEYVRQNPVRARLVADSEDWPYAGEIVLIDRV